MTLELAGIGGKGLARGRRSRPRPDPAVVEALVGALRNLGGRRVLGIGAEAIGCAEALRRAGFEMTIQDPGEARLLGIRRVCRADALCARLLKLPLRSASLDSGVAIHLPVDPEDLEAVFRELHRVVRLGVAVEAVTRENLEGLWYRHYFPEIDPLMAPRRPALGAIVTAAMRGGFVRARATAVCHSEGWESGLEAARKRPAMLFDERFRAAVPAFAALDACAIKAGLDKLRLDLESERFKTVRACFDSRHAVTGDCFVVTLRSR